MLRCKITHLIFCLCFMLSRLYAGSICLDELEARIDKFYLDLASCQLSDNDMQELGVFLKKHPQIDSLDLSGNAISAEGFKTLATFHRKIRYLNLSNMNVTAEEMKALGLFRLKSIKMFHSQLDDEALKALANHALINDLWLENNNFGAEGLKALIKNKSLEVLDIAHNHLTSDAWLILGKSHLRYLDVEDNHIDSSDLAMLVANKSLRFLQLKDNPIGDEGVKILAKTSLTTVNIAHCGITAASMALLAAMDVKAFDVSENAIGDEGIELFAKHRHTSSCADLNISHCGITAKGTDTLYQLNLSYLTINNNAITDEGIKRLATMPRLVSLFAENTDIGDEGLVALASLPSQKRVIPNVSLRNNHITDEGVRRFLASLKGPLYLNVKENPISAEGKALLRNNTSILNLDDEF